PGAVDERGGGALVHGEEGRRVGTPGGSRTPDILRVKQALWPAELRACAAAEATVARMRRKGACRPRRSSGYSSSNGRSSAKRGAANGPADQATSCRPCTPPTRCRRSRQQSSSASPGHVTAWLARSLRPGRTSITRNDGAAP